MLKEKGVSVGFRLRGHAEQGQWGEDLVCAAISAVVQTAIIGITQVLKLNAGYHFDDGITDCVLSKDATATELGNASLLIDTMAEGLKSIEQAYPGTLNFDIREV